MAEKTEFTVARAHWGDKDFTEGGETVTRRHRYEKDEKRLADPADVAAFVQRGILIAPKGKAAASAPAGGDKPGN